MIRYRRRPDGLYESLETYTYYSRRYARSVFIPKGQVRDGASGAFDIHSSSWWVHDQLCADGVWRDQSPVTAWQAATVLSDILKAEGRWARARYWKLTTFLFGCKRAKQNGWFRA